MSAHLGASGTFRITSLTSGILHHLRLANWALGNASFSMAQQPSHMPLMTPTTPTIGGD